MEIKTIEKTYKRINNTNVRMTKTYWAKDKMEMVVHTNEREEWVQATLFNTVTGAELSVEINQQKKQYMINDVNFAYMDLN
jgi:hypothetical protein